MSSSVTPSNPPGPSPPPTATGTSNGTRSIPTSGQILLTEPLARQDEHLATRYKVAMGVLVVAPVLVALPPRKFDAYTFGLGCAWVCCANEVVRFRTGRSLLESIGRNPPLQRQLSQKGGVADEMHRGWMGESVHSHLHPRQLGDGGGGGGGGEDSTGSAGSAGSEAKGAVGQMITRSVWGVVQKRDRPELQQHQHVPEGGAGDAVDRGRGTG